MSRRDALWRGAGAVLSGGACAASLALDGSPLTIIACPLALFGLVLMVRGRKVATALRAERRGHGRTAEAIHAARIRRYRRRVDGPPV